MPEKFPENIKGRLRESHTEKTGERRLWDMSLKFLEGRQWLSFDKRIDGFATSRMRGDAQTRVTVNLLLNITRNITSRLALSYPSIAVLPASPSSEDIEKAKSSEMALRYYWHNDETKFTLERAVKWLVECGTCALHTFFDPDQDRVRTEIIGPYDIFFEKGVIHPDESSWIALRSYVSKYNLKRAYPDHEKVIEEAGADEMSADYGAVSTGTTNEPPKDRISVFEVYWRDGKHAIVIGNTYLFKEDQIPIKTFPVQIIRYTEVSRRLWGLSLLAPLLDLQLLYNKARSQIIANTELMGNPKWLVPKTSGVSNQSITSKPGEKIYYNPAGGAPSQVAAAPMPSYVMDNVMRIQGEMGDVAGIHSVTLGKRAVGVTSGKGMEVLAAHDTSQLQITQQQIERAVKAMAKCVLEFMKVYYTEPKMMSMLDEYGRVSFHSIQSTVINDTPEVFLEAGSLFRDEAQDRDAKIMELQQLGLIDNQTALNELSFRTGNSFISERVRGLSHARDLLDATRAGMNIEIFLHDDLEAAKQVFDEFVKSAEFYDLEEERQDYIRDILVSIATAGAPVEDYQTAMMANKVFPRAAGADRGAIANNIAAANSPNTQQQVIQEQAARSQQAGTAAATERMLTRGAEGNISRAPGSRGAI